MFLEECQSTNRNRLFRQLIDDHHSYVNYTDAPQRRINWLVYETKSGNLIGAIGVSSAVIALSMRDSYIGWNAEQRIANLNKVANNYRFAVINENITLDCAGSIILKALRHTSRYRWQHKYNDPLVLLETYIKPPWQGTVYVADNWIRVGITKGFSIKKVPLKLWQAERGARGELARTNPQEAIRRYASKKSGQRYNITKSEPKHVLIRPLVKEWKEQLSAAK